MHPAVERLPRAPGVYRFRGSGTTVLYVGRAVDLRRRVASYWSDLRGRRHLRRMVPRIERVEVVACDSAHEAAWLERNLLEHSLPRWNRTRGEEVPVYLRLDGSPRSPGLSVVHRVRSGNAVVHFGPYLGSAKAELAVAGLSRVLPIAYAGEGLRGSEADLGRVLGVGALDRTALLDRLTRTLERDPAAGDQVRLELCLRRDEAARALAYERAGQLQTELEALDWVLSEQKATTLEPTILDVAGWSQGLLVIFEIRDGRLRAWSQRPCSRAQAQPFLDATPPAWADFADRNASLAAETASLCPISGKNLA
ncbi:MAG: GIY-YIG nuclease family protein [Kineosporiaceae bacterium]